MITIEQFMKVIQYRITDGSEYGWMCYGSNVYHINSDDESRFSMSITFDTRTQEVYEMEVWDYINDREYRLINPKYVSKYKKEASKRGIKYDQSVDGRNYIDLDVDEDLLAKATAIFNGEDYDSRVIVPLELEKDELFQLMTLAHEADMSLNDFVTQLLQDIACKLKKEKNGHR